MNKPVVNERCLLEKYPGKGGWTYALILKVLQDKKAPFGWVKVQGLIDDFEIKNYKLMPMGKDKLFLPIKKEIRRKIGKQAGDYVTVILYADNTPIEIPEEFLQCLKDEPTAHETFLNYTEGQQKEFIDWIFSAKSDETKVERITVSLKKLLQKKKFRDK